MSIATNIAAMYRGPGRVIVRLLAAGPREDRAIAYLMAGCALMFVALNVLMGGALMGWLFVAPLFFYLLAAVSRLVAGIVGGRGQHWSARIVLFWSLLSAAPVFLLLGLVLGFIGEGAQANIVGLAWAGVFLWFWGRGLWLSERGVVA